MLESEYRIEAKKFAEWSASYLKELNESRRLHYHWESGITDNRTSVTSYYPIAAQEMERPALAGIASLKPRDLLLPAIDFAALFPETKRQEVDLIETVLGRKSLTTRTDLAMTLAPSSKSQDVLGRMFFGPDSLGIQSLGLDSFQQKTRSRIDVIEMGLGLTQATRLIDFPVLSFHVNYRQPSLQVVILKSRYSEILNELKELPDGQRMNALHELTAAEVERLPKEDRIAFFVGVLKQIAPDFERTESGLLVVSREVHHHHYQEGQAQPATADQIRQEKEVQFTPENERYWREIIQHAKKSGNIRQYLSEREIPRSTFYDWKNRLKTLSVRIPGHNPDTEPDTFLLH